MLNSFSYQARKDPSDIVRNVVVLYGTQVRETPLPALVSQHPTAVIDLLYSLRMPLVLFRHGVGREDVFANALNIDSPGLSEFGECPNDGDAGRRMSPQPTV